MRLDSFRHLLLPSGDGVCPEGGEERGGRVKSSGFSVPKLRKKHFLNQYFLDSFII
jgi:hypothetical protein